MTEPSEHDGLSAALAAVRPRQNDVLARSLQGAVLHSLVGAQGEPFRLGRFTVLGLIGSGGMGSVFVAYDPDLDRKIALKVLHTHGEHGRSAVLREGRALARLRHPEIVTVYEVGVVGDQVFVAMEYVEGTNLRVWLRTPRTGAQILGVLIEAGRGLAAAHDAELVHLDVKPENLVVDAGGHLRVIDFGLARSLEELEATAPGASPRSSSSSSLRGGTPEYMAPERLAGARGDARSDQFSFCVTGWEALLGQRPRGGQVPPVGKAEVHPRVVAALRRGMSPDPALRFASMHELLAELTARPARRWLWGLGAAAAAGLVLGAYAVGNRSQAPRCSSPWEQVAVTWNPARAEEVEAAFTATKVPFAPETWATVRTTLDRYADAWGTAHARACEDALVHGIISQSLYEQRLACLEDRRLHLAAVVDRFAGASAATVEHALESVDRLPPIAACDELKPTDAMFAGDPVRLEEILQLRGEQARARALLAAERTADAEPQLAAMLVRARAVGNPMLLTDALLDVGDADEFAGRLERAVERSQEALTIAIAEDLPVQAAKAALSVYQQHARIPDQRTAPGPMLALAAAFSRRAGHPPQLEILVRMTQGNALLDENRFTEALEQLTQTRAYAMEHGSRRHAAAALANLATCYDGFGEHAKAVAALRESLVELEALLGPMHPSLAHVHINLGSVLVELGDHEAARRHMAVVKQIISANYPGDHYMLVAATDILALSYDRQERDEEALAHYREALAMGERLDGPNSPDVASTLCNMAATLRAMHRFDEAVVASARGVAINAESLPPEHCLAMGCTLIHGTVLASLARHAEALTVLEPVLERFPATECDSMMRGELELEIANALWVTDAVGQKARVLALLDAAEGRVTLPGARERLMRLRAAAR